MDKPCGCQKLQRKRPQRKANYAFHYYFISWVISCLTLCDPMDYSPPGSSVHGILQARILEWVAIPISRGIFSTRGLKPGLLQCRQILYHLSHQGSPHIWLLKHFWKTKSRNAWPLKSHVLIAHCILGLLLLLVFSGLGRVSDTVDVVKRWQLKFWGNFLCCCWRS